MIKKIKKMFSKEKKDELTSETLFKEDKVKIKGACTNCPLKQLCEDRNNYDYRCDYAIKLPNFDKNKDSLLIIDDNEGLVSFLLDDIEYFNEKGIIDLDKINVITMSSNMAGFNLEVAQRKLNGLRIKWAIIDITLGGSIMTPEGNKKYTGVDVYEMIIDYNPEMKFIFYTGNNLNPHIKTNSLLIKQFKDINNEDINDYVLFKTALDMDARRKYLQKYLFYK